MTCYQTHEMLVGPGFSSTFAVVEAYSSLQQWSGVQLTCIQRKIPGTTTSTNFQQHRRSFAALPTAKLVTLRVKILLRTETKWPLTT